MKKTLTSILAFVVAVGITACGTEPTKDTSQNTSVSTEASVENTTSAAESDVNNNDEASKSVDWKTFLEEYEAWVDDYVDFMKKYNENPNDISLLSDYTTLATEAIEWSEKANDVELELENNPTALKEYLETLGRITEKLASIS